MLLRSLYFTIYFSPYIFFLYTLFRNTFRYGRTITRYACHGGLLYLFCIYCFQTTLVTIQTKILYGLNKIEYNKAYLKMREQCSM